MKLRNENSDYLKDKNNFSENTRRNCRFVYKNKCI